MLGAVIVQREIRFAIADGFRQQDAIHCYAADALRFCTDPFEADVVDRLTKAVVNLVGVPIIRDAGGD
ncbi:MAG: hypothetical protein COS35_10830, partial [Zetaproteobacteria bacterium CG02_land_8_20_14_3_00_50_9]